MQSREGSLEKSREGSLDKSGEGSLEKSREGSLDKSGEGSLEKSRGGSLEKQSREGSLEIQTTISKSLSNINIAFCICLVARHFLIIPRDFLKNTFLIMEVEIRNKHSAADSNFPIINHFLANINLILFQNF